MAGSLNSFSLNRQKTKQGDIEDQLSHISNESTSEPRKFHVANYKDNSNSANDLKTAATESQFANNLCTPESGRTGAAASKEDFNSSQLIHTITTHQDDPDYVYIDGKKFYKSEVVDAFGGSLVPGYQPRSIYDFANPAPLGLCAFALTTFVSSLVNLRARSVQNSDIVISLALFYGGYWMAWGVLNIDFFGIRSSYNSDDEWNNALGFFLLGWTIFSVLMTLLTFKSTLAFLSLFCFVSITYLFLTIAQFTQNIGVQKAGGAFGVIAALLAWYNAFSGLATKENSYFVAEALRLPNDAFHRNYPHTHCHNHSVFHHSAPHKIE